jgi:hypothetical protein
MIAFEFEGERYPISPMTVFYDWLYFKALYPHGDWIEKREGMGRFHGYRVQPRAFNQLPSAIFCGICRPTEARRTRRDGRSLSKFQDSMGIGWAVVQQTYAFGSNPPHGLST